MGTISRNIIEEIFEQADKTIEALHRYLTQFQEPLAVGYNCDEFTPCIKELRKYEEMKKSYLGGSTNARIRL